MKMIKKKTSNLEDSCKDRKKFTACICLSSIPNIKKKPSADNGCNNFSLDSYFIPVLFLQKNI